MPVSLPTFSDIRLQPGDVIRDKDISRVAFQQCAIDPAHDKDSRVRLERLHLSNVRATFCHLRAAVIRDCTMENMKLERSTGFIWACEFERVTFKGKFNPLVIQPGIGLAVTPPLKKLYKEWVTEHDRTSTEWSIDISEATGVVDIRGYRASRMILNPDLHAVVRREDALRGNTDWLMQSGSLFRIGMTWMLEQGWEDVVLIANPHSKAFGSELDAIARLRDEGIADTAARAADGNPS